MKGVIPRKRIKRAQPITAATRFIPATSGPKWPKKLSAKLPKKPPTQPKPIVLSRQVGIAIGISLLPINLSKIAIANKMKKPATLTLAPALNCATFPFSLMLSINLIND